MSGLDCEKLSLYELYIYTVWKRNGAKFIYLKLLKAVYNF